MLPSSWPAALGPHILAYLPGPDRFRLATLLQIERIQALALYSIQSASLAEASAQGLVELLDFRLRNAKSPIASVNPVESLFWILRSSETTTPPNPSTPATARFPHVRIEWWDNPDGNGDVVYALSVTRALHIAAMKNHVAVLEWWMTKAQALTVYGEVSVKKIASAALIGGALDVMRWCKETQGWNPLDVDIWSLRLAASSNHANALNWLESEAGTAGAVAQRIIQVDYTDPALQLAQLRRRLEAHTATGDGAELATPLDFRDAADFGAENGQVAVLEWIRGTGGSFLLERVVTAATERGHVAVLNWWRSHYPLDTWRPSDRSIWRAGFDGHVAVLQFWWDAGVEPASWSFEILRVAAERGFVSVFQWWAEHLQSPDTEQCLVIVEKAVESGRLELLRWFKTSGYIQPLQCPITTAAKNPKAFLWWTQNRLPLTNDISKFKSFVRKHSVNPVVLKWLVATRENADSADSGTWSWIPADDKWPLLDLVHLGARSDIYGLSTSLLREGVLDALEWWRERGAPLGTGHDLKPHARRLVEECLPFLEWLSVRNLGTAVFHDHETGEEMRARRWWKEAEQRWLPPAPGAFNGLLNE